VRGDQGDHVELAAADDHLDAAPLEQYCGSSIIRPERFPNPEPLPRSLGTPTSQFTDAIGTHPYQKLTPWGQLSAFRSPVACTKKLSELEPPYGIEP
jgi:hypothetical protein